MTLTSHKTIKIHFYQSENPESSTWKGNALDNSEELRNSQLLLEPI